MPPSIPRAALLAATGLAWVLTEAFAARLAPWPLDPSLSWPALLGAALFTSAALAGLGWALRRWPRTALTAPLALWAALWAPEGMRVMGQPAVLGAVVVLALAGLALARPRWAVAVTVAGALVVPLARPRLDAPVVGPTGQGSSILLVTVDAVRADAGLLAGPDGPVGPGWWTFSQAIAPAPWTLPSMHSLMSGRPVVEHGGGLAAGSDYTHRHASASSFVERLAAAGWETSAFVSNPHLRASQGFAAGFHQFWHDDDAREPLLLGQLLDRRLAGWLVAPTRLRRTRDDRLVEAARAAMATPSDRPRFVWVHLLGPHEYRRLAEPAPRGWTPGTTEPVALRRAYAANIAAARARVVSLVSAAPDAVVAVTSDHGEAFGEAGVSGHGHQLQDAELRVPLALRVPGEAGQTVEVPVSTVDLAHTLLVAAGVPGYDTFPGADLRAGAPGPIQVAGVRADPGAAAVRDESGAYTPAPAGPAGAPMGISDEEREALQQLGYTF